MNEIVCIDPETRTGTRIAGDSGSADAARFRGVEVLAFGADGSLFIADNGNVRIRRIRFLPIAGTPGVSP